LRAQVQPFLAEGHDLLCVRVACCGEEVAEWRFGLEESAKLQWRKARLKRRRDASSRAELRLSFAIDAPRSPYELGLSDDRRLLGLRFAKLKVSAAEPAAPKRRTLTR
jgi:hypothetical protein